MTTEEFLVKLTGVKKSGAGWTAKCPAHEDRAASLSVSAGGDGRVLVKCFAGCTADAICSSLGLKMKDLFPDQPRQYAPKREKGQRRIVATYDYYTKDKTPLVRVVRFEPKAFARMSPAAGGGWQWGKTGDTVALYRWPELADAVGHGRTVYLVEGEKDVENMRMVGAVCTTCLGGASKWRPELAKEFRGAEKVVIIADRDGEANKFAGQKFAVGEKKAIRAAGVPVRAVCLPEEINGRKVKDASDALAAGWTFDQIATWCANAEEVDAPRSVVAPESESGAGGDGETLREAIAAALGDAAMEDVAGRKKLTAEEKRKTIIGAALEWMRGHGAFYYDADAVDASGAFYFCRESKELMRVTSDLFQSWLAYEGDLSRITNEYRALHAACVDEALRSATSKKVSPSLFWEYRDGKIYISNGDGEMVRISPGSAEVVDNGTDEVLFLTGRTCAPWGLLPRERGVPIYNMRVIGDLSTPENNLSPLLITLWALSLPRNLKNKPPLSLCGDVGSGKTRTAIGLYEVLGLAPRICTAEKSEKGAEEFWVSAGYGGISTIDNVDSRCKWLPDAVAGASTGGTKEKRKLYSDADLAFVKSRSALILTSANPLYATDPGLADRLINVQFARPEARSRSDGDLSVEIAENRDAIMTWMAWTLSDALSVTADPPDGLNRRHPDWGAWCWKCGVALGFPAEAEEVLRHAEAVKADVSIRSDTIFGSVIYRVMRELGRPWEGTAAELAKLLLNGGGDGCGVYADDGYMVLEGAVQPEDYDFRTKDYVTAHRLGNYFRVSKAQLTEVFGLSSRILRGTALWTLHPPEARWGGCGVSDTPFLTYIRNFFKKELETGGTDTPHPPPAAAEPTPEPVSEPAAAGSGPEPSGPSEIDPFAEDIYYRDES